MGQLLLNDKHEFAPTIEDLKAMFGHEGIDWKRPLAFQHLGHKKIDPDNGRPFDPSFDLDISYSAVLDIVDPESTKRSKQEKMYRLTYFRTLKWEGKNPVTTPKFILARGLWHVHVDLNHPKADLALALFLLKHPLRGQVFDLENYEKRAATELATEKELSRIKAAFTLEDYAGYITSEGLGAVALALGVTEQQVNTLSDAEIRTLAQRLALSDPKKFARISSSKGRQVGAVVNQAKSAGLIEYEDTTGGWHLVLLESEGHEVLKRRSADPFMVVPEEFRQARDQRLLEHLEDESNSDDLAAIKALIREHREMKAAQTTKPR
jgi:chromosome segregation and condensation protein ScpB